MDNYLKEENERESHALGDVDPTAEETDDFEFFFTLEEVKKKYADYLSLTPQDFEQTNDEETEEDTEEEAEESGKAESEEENDDTIEKDKLIDEIKTLNINNQEEATYQDYNFWKSNIDYDIDSLMNEL